MVVVIVRLFCIYLWAMAGWLVAVETQSRPADAGAVSGVVVDANDSAVAGAAVTARWTSGARQQLTDNQGRFALLGIPSTESLVVDVRRVGYLDAAYGQTDAGGPGLPIRVSAGGWINTIKVVLHRPGSVSGEVTSNGAPVPSVPVRVLRRVKVGGSPQFVTGPVVMTDDVGRYRVSGLPSGDYAVEALSIQMSVPSVLLATAPFTGPNGLSLLHAMRLTDGLSAVLGAAALAPVKRSGGMTVFPSTFYPDNRSIAGAAVLSIKPDQDLRHIEIRVDPVNGYTVSGELVGAEGRLADLDVRLLTHDAAALGLGSETAVTRADAHGRFTFCPVPSGEYVIKVSDVVSQLNWAPANGSNVSAPSLPHQSTSSSSWRVGESGEDLLVSTTSSTRATTVFGGELAVTVGASDISSLVVDVRPFAKIKGVLDFDGGDKAPTNSVLSVTGIQVTAEDTSSGPGARVFATRVAAGTNGFAISVPQGAFALHVPAGPVRIKKITRNEADVPSAGLAVADQDIDNVRVVLTRQHNQISGTVSQSGSAPRLVRVICFPRERTRWAEHSVIEPVVQTRLLVTGSSYRVTDLPAGVYYVVAVLEQAADWTDSAVLDRLVKDAKEVSLDWESATTVDLSVSAISISRHHD